MTTDELKTLENDLKRFGDEYCQTGGLQNYEVQVNHTASIVGVVIDRKLRAAAPQFAGMPWTQLSLDDVRPVTAKKEFQDCGMSCWTTQSHDYGRECVLNPQGTEGS